MVEIYRTPNQKSWLRRCSNNIPCTSQLRCGTFLLGSITLLGRNPSVKHYLNAIKCSKTPGRAWASDPSGLAPTGIRHLLLSNLTIEQWGVCHGCTRMQNAPTPILSCFEISSTLLLELQCSETYCYKLFTILFTKQAVSVEELIPCSLFR